MAKAELVKKHWGRKLDFILSLVGYSVGLGNLWRFPYVVNRNGGGAFLIPFILCILLCGCPLFFLEVAIGQYSGRSAFHVWNVCPLFRGIGMTMNAVSILCALYYNIIIAWTLYYLGHSFFPTLPWRSCGNSWNTKTCISLRDCQAPPLNATVTSNVTDYVTSNVTSLLDVIGNGSDVSLPSNASRCDYSSKRVGLTSAEEFWQNKMLNMTGGLSELGEVKWELLVCFMAAWFLIFLCLMKGIKSLGKVVYVTATLPYALLLVILIRGATLPGAMEGVIFYLTPDFGKLLKPQVWIEALVQVFYSLGPAWGTLIIMSSHNKFHNNCLRDAVMITAIGEGTSLIGGFAIFSVLGYMANQANVGVESVVKSGPGLGFIAYPEALASLPLPHLWSVLFFLMLLSVGLDTQFGMVEIACGTVLECYPRLFAKRRVLLTGILCMAAFLIGIPLTTQGGIYVFQLMDWYSTSFGLPLVGVLECIVLGWIYGKDRLSANIHTMLGRKPPLFMMLAWRYFTPLLLGMALVFAFVTYTPPTYGNYKYPGWARGLGWALGLLPTLPVPAVMVYELCKRKGSFMERLRDAVKPCPSWDAKMLREEAGRQQKSSSLLDPLDPCDPLDPPLPHDPLSEESFHEP